MATARSFLLVLSSLSFIISCSLQDPTRAALDHMTENKWSAAESDFRKAFRKDTLSVETNYYYAKYFLSAGNPEFSTDSAQLYTDKALTAWHLTTPRQRQRLDVDSLAIVDLHAGVDSTAFENARKQNTVEAYTLFIDHYPLANDHLKAIELRDELAYLEALRKNTPRAFKDYVNTYPKSSRVDAANDHYEQLIFNEKTSSGNVNDYKSFLVEFPKSAFREQAEKFIFETTTSLGSIDDYLSFIQQYPEGSQSSKAKNILYYLMRDEGRQRPASVENDSLRMLDERNKGYWVPFLKNGLYGFMNEDGAEVMSPQFEEIDESYLCGDIKSDFVVTSSGVYSRSGVLLLKKTHTAATDLGKGFLNIADGKCHTIVHQSGFQVGDDCVEDARIIADQFVAVKKENTWNVYAINGKQLLTSTYEDVTSVDKLIILKRYGKSIVVMASNVAATSAQKPLNKSLVFDEVRAWGDGNLWVKNGVLEGVIGQDLQFIIPLDRQILTKTSFGFTKTKDGKIQVIGVVNELESQSYDDVHDYGDWLELISGRKSILYRVSQKKIVASNLDSAWIKNRVAFGAKNDSLNVYVGSSRLASFDRSAPVSFIKGSDSVVYFWVSERKNKVVYEASQGKKLFSSDFDDIEVIGPDLFVFTRKNKKGILRRDGKVLQQSEYDAVIPSSSQYLSLLKEKKFGLYDTKNQKLIKPRYDRNVLPYSENYFIAYKGGYGIVTAAEEPVTSFDFEEIKYWNDTAAWVKRNSTWSILSIKDKSIKLSKVRSFQGIKDHDGEKIVRVQIDNYFGIVSNRKGVIIGPTFTEVLNIGSDDKPFYFTEKRVVEADIYVVIYYNSAGELVRKQVYEEEEYEKIYCEN
ncbi:MAG TPA: WG repeat-containing protein [Cyclobacteriaceae bacterium]